MHAAMLCVLWMLRMHAITRVTCAHAMMQCVCTARARVQTPTHSPPPPWHRPPAACPLPATCGLRQLPTTRATTRQPAAHPACPHRLARRPRSHSRALCAVHDARIFLFPNHKDQAPASIQGSLSQDCSQSKGPRGPSSPSMEGLEELTGSCSQSKGPRGPWREGLEALTGSSAPQHLIRWASCRPRPPSASCRPGPRASSRRPSCPRA